MQAYSFVRKKSSCARKINISHIRLSISISFFTDRYIRYPVTYDIIDSLLFLDVVEFSCSIVAVITNQPSVPYANVDGKIYDKFNCSIEGWINVNDSWSNFDTHFVSVSEYLSLMLNAL